MSSHNKLIIILSELIFVNILIIANIVITTSKTQDIERNLQVPKQQNVISKPKMTFGDILAKVIEAPQVLGISETTTPKPTHQPSFKSLSKEKYTIAIIGDSMEETMGDSLDYLQKSLKEIYPTTKFSMYNYGIGSEKVTEGLERLNKPFDRGNRHYPPLTELKPDILIVGSYAYNPFDTHDPLNHHNKLAELVNRARQITPKTYMLAEIAPIESGFGTGVGGVNWPEDLASKHTLKIIDQMQNSLVISKELTLPLINVFDASKKANSTYGKPQYISTHDHIHPSILGQIFTAENIVKQLNLD